MKATNVEFKAHYEDLQNARRILSGLGARFEGEDHQIDTYFNVRRGRLKLRQGVIESNLIFYKRGDIVGARKSNVRFWPVEPPGNELREDLTNKRGILIVVDKRREIYFIDNVKFHLDVVDGLGRFVEAEAIDYEGTIGVEKLRAQCEHYKRRLGVRDADLVAGSYSDLLLQARMG